MATSSWRLMRASGAWSRRGERQPGHGEGGVAVLGKRDQRHAHAVPTGGEAEAHIEFLDALLPGVGVELA
jgi:hypothetical protein